MNEQNTNFAPNKKKKKKSKGDHEIPCCERSEINQQTKSIRVWGDSDNEDAKLWWWIKDEKLNNKCKETKETKQQTC